MDASTTAKHTRTEQCRKNAQAKSEQKRKATFTAIRELQHEKHPITRSAVARRTGVSVVFLRSHPDLLQALSEAEQQHRLAPAEGAGDRAKDQVIAALRRRLDEMKQQLIAKDQELRGNEKFIGCMGNWPLPARSLMQNCEVLSHKSWSALCNKIHPRNLDHPGYYQTAKCLCPSGT